MGAWAAVRAILDDVRAKTRTTQTLPSGDTCSPRRHSNAGASSSNTFQVTYRDQKAYYLFDPYDAIVRLAPPNTPHDSWHSELDWTLHMISKITGLLLRWSGHGFQILLEAPSPPLFASGVVYQQPQLPPTAGAIYQQPQLPSTAGAGAIQTAPPAEAPPPPNRTVVNNCFCRWKGLTAAPGLPVKLYHH